ncbi:hypothetical protein AB0I28_31125 [Phytomonospora sp. NPDC050363]|uniref:hypothetical protein n=1 Tax=Phytomonospora sp. NPDC050363 TaxID=3155642 RepID=UPI0033DC75D4
MSPADLAQLLVAFLAAAVLTARLPTARESPRTPESRWLTALLACTAAAVIVGWPPLMTALAGDGGGLVALRLVQHAFVLAMGLTFLAFSEHGDHSSTTTRRRVLRWAAGFAVALCVMVASAVVGHLRTPDAPSMHLLTPEYATTSAIAVYLAAYALPLAAIAGRVAVLCFGRFRRAENVAPRVAFLLFFVGSTAGGLYCVLRAVAAILTAAGGSPDTAGVSFVLTLVAMVCVLAAAATLAALRLGQRATNTRDPQP